MNEIGLENLRAAARAAIEAAFPVEPVPPVKDVRNDHCPECAELAVRFVGKRWDEILLTDLCQNPSPSLLTPAAFKYHLPAMMLHSMENPAALDCFPDDLIGALSPSGGKPSPHQSAMFASFTVDQAAAIVAFLRHYQISQGASAPEDDVGRRVIVRALKYWSELVDRPMV